jgi:hypothetical protein
MSTSQLSTSTTPKQDDYPTRARRFTILIGLGLLGYYGYCFGLWGRGSLLLQYLFQCGCPGFSGELRYPREVDFIMSACQREEIILSPSGRLLMIVPKARINRLIVALPPDLAHIPDQAFLSSAFDVPDDGDVNRAESFLQENSIHYEPVYALAGGDIVSPDGRFIARNDGIYLAATDQLLVEAPIEGVQGWIYDGRGAIYTGRDCVFLLSLPGLDMSCLAWINQPVILLKVPEEYLSSTPTP